MAVIDYEEVQPPAGFVVPSGTKIFKWPKTGQAFTEDDTGKPLPCGHYADKVVQVYVAGDGATFNGATTTIQGALHPDPAAAVYASLHEPGGNALAYTAAGLNQVLENAESIRPAVTVADPTGLVILVHLYTSARR